VTTSSLRGRGRLRAISLAELPGLLAEVPESGRAALVFGHGQQSGLTEEEIARATCLLRLPTSEAFPTMNLSHAVAAVLAAVRAHDTAPAAEPANPRDPLAPAEEVEAAVAHWDRRARRERLLRHGAPRPFAARLAAASWPRVR
jgi:tRNA/rRNA methyltransferase